MLSSPLDAARHILSHLFQCVSGHPSPFTAIKASTMLRLSIRNTPLLSCVLFLLVLVHVRPTASQPNCNSISCAPDLGPSCTACNASSTSPQCQKAWHDQPGFSCGTAVGKSSTGRVTYNAQCCPTESNNITSHYRPPLRHHPLQFLQRFSHRLFALCVTCRVDSYNGASFHCQALSYSSVAGGVTYEVEGFSCVKTRSGLSAAAVVGMTTGIVAMCVVALLISCYMYRRRLAASAAALPLSFQDGEADGAYTAPLVQPQPPQPFTTQPYNLDMQQNHASPPYNVRAERAQPQSSGSSQLHDRLL